MFVIFLLFLTFVNSLNLNHFNLNNFNLNIINKSSGILPKIDIFGHKILELNHDLICKITESDLDVLTKKVLILDILKATQLGDNFGSFILSNYYHIVDKLL